MNDVLIDAGGKIGADRALGRFLRIGGAHDLAVLGDGTIALEHLYHHGTGGHELHQILEERPLAMHGVKALGFSLRQLHHARRDHPQAGCFEPAIHLADQITAHAVRLHDGKGTLNWHDDLGCLDGKSAPKGADKDREVYWRGALQAIRTGAEVPVLLGKAGPWLQGSDGAQRLNQTLKLSPQPHSPLALGFWNLNASFRPCLTKSTTVPSIKARLSASTTTLTPRASKTESLGR